MTTPTATPRTAPVDAETRSKLRLISSDRLHEDERATVEAAIAQTAREHGGLVDPNALRALLTNEHGSIVSRGVVGATILALKKRGVLRHAGWVITTGSRTGNNGRQAQAYWADLAVLDGS